MRGPRIDEVLTVMEVQGGEPPLRLLKILRRKIHEDLPVAGQVTGAKAGVAVKARSTIKRCCLFFELVFWRIRRDDSKTPE